MTQKNYNGAVYSWAYDARGNVAKFTDDVEDKTYTYTYDLSDRLIESYRSDNAYVRQSFNAQNLTSGVKFGFGGAEENTSYVYSGNLDNAPYRATFTGVGNELFSYDALGRTTAAKIRNGSNALVYQTDYTYKDKNSTQTSGVVSRVKNAYSSTVFSDYTYTYDANGNITRVTDKNGKVAAYTYDSLNRLTRCDDEAANKSWTFTYDKKGNITQKLLYTGNYVDTALPASPTTTVNYAYGNSVWADLLTSYKNKTVIYDTIGNMTAYDGRQLVWSGRRLESFTYNNKTTTYTYNADGIRTSKTVDGTKTEYFLNGTQILAQKTGSNTPMVFYYDHNGKRVAFKNTDGAVYFYVYNLQGDVVQILDSSRNIVGEYQYDPYGRVQNTLTSIAAANPFRYRGYYFDSENGYYYLNARYYYPVFGRFISADEIVVTTLNNRALTEKNLFVYCNNNPVNYKDDGGYCAHIVVGAVVGAVIGGLSAALSGGDGVDIIIGVVAGAAGGALTASGVLVAGQIIGGALIAAASNSAQQINKIVKGKQEKFDAGDMLFDAAIGGICGAWGGNGASYGNTAGIKSQEKRLLKDGITKITKQSWRYFKTQAHNAGKQFVFTSLKNSTIKNFVGSVGITVKNVIKRALK